MTPTAEGFLLDGALRRWEERQLADAIEHLLPSDTLLFRGWNGSLISAVIATYGRGPYRHAAKIGPVNGCLYAAEMREWCGFRLVPLERLVREQPGMIDVYRPDPFGHFGYERDSAWKAMLAKSTTLYNYLGVLKAGLRSAPLIRFLVDSEPAADKGDAEPREHCSQAVSSADRIGGGVDPVANTPDAFTEPNDLWRSLLYEQGYLFTLVP